MAQQLRDLIKPISEMSDAELLEKIRSIRKNKYEIRPAKVKHTERAARGDSHRAVSKLGKLAQGLSEEEREELIKSLTEDSDDGQTEEC